MMRNHNSSANMTIVTYGIVKTNLGPVGFGDEVELFPKDRPKGLMSHAFESAQRFRSHLENKGEQ